MWAFMLHMTHASCIVYSKKQKTVLVSSTIDISKPKWPLPELFFLFAGIFYTSTQQKPRLLWKKSCELWPRSWSLMKRFHQPDWWSSSSLCQIQLLSSLSKAGARLGYQGSLWRPSSDGSSGRSWGRWTAGSEREQVVQCSIHSSHSGD